MKKVSFVEKWGFYHFGHIFCADGDEAFKGTKGKELSIGWPGAAEDFSFVGVSLDFLFIEWGEDEFAFTSTEEFPCKRIKFHALDTISLFILRFRFKVRFPYNHLLISTINLKIQLLTKIPSSCHPRAISVNRQAIDIRFMVSSDRVDNFARSGIIYQNKISNHNKQLRSIRSICDAPDYIGELIAFMGWLCK